MDVKTYDNIGETLYSETLQNGLTVYVLPKLGYKRAFAVFATHYGGAMRRFALDGETLDTPAGVAHFLEHKMFDMPDGKNALASLSESGASPNAFTGYDMTAYYFSCTEGFEKDLRELLTFVSTPYFSAESVQKEQGIIGQEIRMTEDNPGFAVYLNLMRCLYGEGPMTESVAGTVESIAEITDRVLYDCHRAFYRPSNMVLCVAGDVDPEAVSRMAREILPENAGNAPAPDFGRVPAGAPAKEKLAVNMEVSAPQFMLGSLIAPAPKGKARARQTLVGELALSVLMGRASPFYTKLYAEGLLTNDFSYELDYSGGGAAFIAGGESPEPEKVLEALKAAARDAAENGLDQKLFENRRKALYGNRLTAFDRFDQICVGMASGFFGGYLETDCLGLIPGITREECAEFIRTYLDPRYLALSVVSPVK